MISSGQYQRLRAPAENGGKLILPAGEELPELIRTNRHQLRTSALPILDQTLADLSLQARREFLSQSSLRTDHGEPPAETLLVLTGHQPELFHPGVWLKNFVAARLARAVGGAAGNLVIDSDLCRSAAIALPAGTPQNPHRQLLPFDALAVEQPYEERRIVDRGVWESFGGRVAETLAPFVSRPLIERLWPRVLEISRRNDSIAEILSTARHEQEIAWGFGALECTQSNLCQSASLRRFALHLWNHAAAFREAHNLALADYRRTHRLRSPAQPLPDLSCHGPWAETPFWVWDSRALQRRGLYVRCDGDSLLVGDQHEFTARLPRGAAAVEECLALLAELETAGIKIRTRALATTLFTRLLIADLFIHGIGGAKYDQVTNSIAEGFFGIALPRYATVTGTLRLPIDVPRGAVADEQELLRRLRDIRFHPETLQHEMPIAPDDDQFTEIEHIAQTKQLWVNTPKTRTNAAQRHRQIADANRQLAERLQDYRRTIELVLAEKQQTKQHARILFSREYSYCLHPEGELQEFLLARLS